MKKLTRKEEDVFADLAELVRSPGYIHAIAQICVRDNLIIFSDEMKSEDMSRLFSGDRLLRTEITTILGLLSRDSIDFTLQDAETINEYVEKTDRIMQELHDAIGRFQKESIFDALRSGRAIEDIWTGEAMREPIFYGGEAAYIFQYRDMLLEKYGADDHWIIKNKRFSISQAQTIANTMYELLNENILPPFREIKRNGIQPDTWLVTFEIDINEIVSKSGISAAEVRAFLDAFTLHGVNSQFKTIGDFNALNASPLLKSAGDTVLFFQPYSLFESLYESPFYWLMADQSYKAPAAQHRGQFTENFTAQRLSGVFGADRVHMNVELIQKKAAHSGEIDVLVVFGNRLIIVQAKSKKLTLAARRGNDGQLRKDFAGAIQDSYDQAWSCANLILEPDCKLVAADGTEIKLAHRPKEILIFNVVAEHYPALAFQTRQYLKYETSEIIRAPFVMDVFLLDALTEMLETPLRLLSYANLRVENIQRLTMSHELTALAFHLKRNLWIDPEFNMVMLEDDIAADLDLAMMVRRDNVPGLRTPDGVLTHLAGTPFDNLISQIDRHPDPGTVEFGLALLALDEDTCRTINNGLEFITKQTLADGKLHDFSIGDERGGFTFHSNPTRTESALQKLESHCAARKYATKAPKWLGISVSSSQKIQFGVVLEHDWKQSDEMDAVTAGMKKAVPVGNLASLARGAGSKKVGRNDPCPCHSGKKYKKCCFNR